MRFVIILNKVLCMYVIMKWRQAATAREFTSDALAQRAPRSTREGDEGERCGEWISPPHPTTGSGREA